MMELLLNLDDISPDIDGDEKERRMASLNPSRHFIKSFFNVPAKNDGDDGNDGEEGEENSDGEEDGEGEEDDDVEEERSTAALTLARSRWSVRPASRVGE